ncbi:hypothetical protein HDV00_011571 [Rhizophlyctis rosea]|nr:hypothetical protein HDV00_011571 [Rhizophlyctis rosea]
MGLKTTFAFAAPAEWVLFTSLLIHTSSSALVFAPNPLPTTSCSTICISPPTPWNATTPHTVQWNSGFFGDASSLINLTFLRGTVDPSAACDTFKTGQYARGGSNYGWEDQAVNVGAATVGLPEGYNGRDMQHFVVVGLNKPNCLWSSNAGFSILSDPNAASTSTTSSSPTATAGAANNTTTPTTDSYQSQLTDQKNKLTGVLIGVIICVILLALLICLGGYLIHRRNREDQSPKVDTILTSTPQSSSTPTPLLPTTSRTGTTSHSSTGTTSTRSRHSNDTPSTSSSLLSIPPATTDSFARSSISSLARKARAGDEGAAKELSRRFLAASTVLNVGRDASLERERDKADGVSVRSRRSGKSAVSAAGTEGAAASECYGSEVSLLHDRGGQVSPSKSTASSSPSPAPTHPSPPPATDTPTPPATTPTKLKQPCPLSDHLKYLDAAVAMLHVDGGTPPKVGELLAEESGSEVSSGEGAGAGAAGDGGGVAAAAGRESGEGMEGRGYTDEDARMVAEAFLMELRKN